MEPSPKAVKDSTITRIEKNILTMRSIMPFQLLIRQKHNIRSAYKQFTGDGIETYVHDGNEHVTACTSHYNTYLGFSFLKRQLYINKKKNINQNLQMPQ
jgi:hypothetical protein